MKETLKKTAYRGGTDTERLYLEDADLNLKDGTCVVVKKSKSTIKNYSMADHIARHKGRYSAIGLFARPERKILDFPCGSGYAAEFLKPFGLIYTGLDNDPATIAYAEKIYGDSQTKFAVGNLEKPDLKDDAYDIIACIEGIEHIRKEFQIPLVENLAKAVKPGGVLIVSSPENPTGISGPSVHNKDHLWELNREDFLNIIYSYFEPENVDVISQTATLSTGVTTVCLYAICHKSKQDEK